MALSTTTLFGKCCQLFELWQDSARSQRPRSITAQENTESLYKEKHLNKFWYGEKSQASCRPTPKTLFTTRTGQHWDRRQNVGFPAGKVLWSQCKPWLTWSNVSFTSGDSLNYVSKKVSSSILQNQIEAETTELGLLVKLVLSIHCYSSKWLLSVCAVPAMADEANQAWVIVFSVLQRGIYWCKYLNTPLWERQPRVSG